MPNEFTFVGEHRDNTDQLLVLGADGNYYRYQPAQESFSQVEPDESWRFFSTSDEAPEAAVETEAEPS